MKQIFIITLLAIVLASCNTDNNVIVSADFADSLILHYTTPASIRSNEDDIRFWKDRINPDNPGFTNEVKYASALACRFHMTGDIKDILASDSIIHKVDTVYNHKEASPYLSLAEHAILQHQFTNADSLLLKAKAVGLKPYEDLTASFDVDFELGNYNLAESELKKIIAGNDYGYYFRLSKLLHYKGELDSAIVAIQKAIVLAGNDIALRQAAISNTADLYLHNSHPQKAYELYIESIRLNSADLHSIMGIGWIALVHDKNTSLASRIFSFVNSRTKSPDPLFKLIQAADAAGDSSLGNRYARQFEALVTNGSYGNMYNKYLIELYTGILNEPAKAEVIAKRELLNRATPQTNAWYVWTLFFNNKKEEAYTEYKNKVSGKPLEGLELYWMGKMMQGLDKGYNAQQFFKAAWKNRYDLSPGKTNDMEVAFNL